MKKCNRKKKHNQDKQKIYLMTCFASTMNSRACATKQNNIYNWTWPRPRPLDPWTHPPRFRLKKKQILEQDCFGKPKTMRWGKTLQLDSICLFYFRSVILDDHEGVKKKCTVINNTRIQQGFLKAEQGLL